VIEFGKYGEEKDLVANKIVAVRLALRIVAPLQRMIRGKGKVTSMSTRRATNCCNKLNFCNDS